MATLTTNYDCLPTIFDFLNPQDKATASQVNSTFNASGKTSLRVCSEEIKKLPYLNQLASKHPLESTFQGAAELAKRVIPEAIRNVRKNYHILEQGDWTELNAQKPKPSKLQFLKYVGYKTDNEPSISNLSLGQLNRANELIQTRSVDLDLERTFTKIFDQVPVGERPQLAGTLPQRAAAIRNWLETNPGALNRITSLDLSNLKLTSLPPEIMQLINLGTLNLAENPITHLPENLNLPALTRLGLNNTPITHLPENLNFPALTHLWLNNTLITHLPENLNFPALTDLQLNNTPITHLPENLNLPALIILWLNNTQITHLPENLNLPALTGLYLNNTQITHLPENLNLPALTGLYLNNTPITHLPENLNFPALTHLWLSNTQITHLPANLNLPALTWLQLGNTPITHLPENLNLPALIQLELSNTQITHLPETLNLPALTHLGLSNTQITHLPENLNLPALTSLWLDNTPITHLPENLNLPALMTLWLNNTQITHLPENINFPLMGRMDRLALKATITFNQVNSFRKQAWNSINQNRCQAATILGAATAALCAGIYATQRT